MYKLVFSLIWWLGFAITVGLMLGLYFDVGIIERHVASLFLIIGIQHMVVLVILGFLAIKIDNDDNVEVGSRVATMGYLHTLIGTSVALIMTAKFGADMIEHINTIISPIGSALITSIIGWAFGKEMERDRYRYKLEKTEKAENAMEFLSDKLITVAHQIEQSSQAWNKNIEQGVTQLVSTTQELNTQMNLSVHNSQEVMDGLTKSFSNLHQQMQTNLEEMNQLITKDLEKASKVSKATIEESMRTFQLQFELLEKSISSMEKNFSQSSKDADRVFKNSIDTFEKSLDQMGSISKEWDRHIKSMKRFSTHSESALDQFTYSSQKVIDEISTVANNIPKAGKMIDEIDTFISKTKIKR